MVMTSFYFTRLIVLYAYILSLAFSSLLLRTRSDSGSAMYDVRGLLPVELCGRMVRLCVSKIRKIHTAD